MKKQLVSFLSILSIASTVALWSCKKSDDAQPIVSNKITDLPADPGTSTNQQTGEVTGTKGEFTFYSFRDNKIIARSDSASTKWDIGFRGLNIIMNGGTSGPGTVQGQVLTNSIAAITQAPTSGYVQDNVLSTDNPKQYALSWGTNRQATGWAKLFTYNSTTHTINATPGKVVILKLADNAHVKFEIVSFYKGAPASPTLADTQRYYTINYVYQPNGTTFQ